MPSQFGIVTGMSIQLTVRLPDDLVNWIDERASQAALSRAAVIAAAVERERRRAVAERDAAILAASTNDDDADGIAEFGSKVSMPDLA